MLGRLVIGAAIMSGANAAEPCDGCLGTMATGTAALLAGGLTAETLDAIATTVTVAHETVCTSLAQGNTTFGTCMATGGADASAITACASGAVAADTTGLAVKFAAATVKCAAADFAALKAAAAIAQKCATCAGSAATGITAIMAGGMTTNTLDAMAATVTAGMETGCTTLATATGAFTKCLTDDGLDGTQTTACITSTVAADGSGVTGKVVAAATACAAANFTTLKAACLTTTEAAIPSTLAAVATANTLTVANFGTCTGLNTLMTAFTTCMGTESARDTYMAANSSNANVQVIGGAGTKCAALMANDGCTKCMTQHAAGLMGLAAFNFSAEPTADSCSTFNTTVNPLMTCTTDAGMDLTAAFTCAGTYISQTPLASAAAPLIQGAQTVAVKCVTMKAAGEAANAAAAKAAAEAANDEKSTAPIVVATLAAVVTLAAAFL